MSRGFMGLSPRQRALWDACHSCDYQHVETELHAQFDARFADETGITPLMIGIDSGMDCGFLEKLAKASDLSAVDGEGEGVIHRAARHQRSILFDWLARVPFLAVTRSAGGRLACRDAAYVRCAPGLAALLRAQISVEGEQATRLAAIACMPSLMARGAMVGDRAELESLRRGPQFGGGLAMPARAALAMRSGWEGPEGERRHAKKVAEQSLDIEACLDVLWPWIGFEHWDKALGDAASAPQGAMRIEQHHRAMDIARAFRAGKEVEQLEDSAAQAGGESQGKTGRL